MLKAQAFCVLMVGSANSGALAPEAGQRWWPRAGPTPGRCGRPPDARRSSPLTAPDRAHGDGARV